MYWDPFDEMREFQRRTNKEFGSFFSKINRKDLLTDVHSLLNNIVDEGDHIIVKMGLPGVDKENIVLTVTDHSLEVKAQKKHELKVEKKGFYKHERSYGGFYRMIPLPSNVNPESVKSVFKNGVLKIRLQKSKSKKIVKKVEVG